MDGTPTDSVTVAFAVALAEQDIDLVVSGANAGENLGIIANNSGTVSAAVRALRLGYPSIAISVSTDLANLYAGFQLLRDEDPTNDALGYQLIQQAAINQAESFDDAGQWQRLWLRLRLRLWCLRPGSARSRDS